MRQLFLMAGISAFAISAPALAQPAAPAHSGAVSPIMPVAMVLAQMQLPGSPPAVVTAPAPGTTVVIAPTAPPPPQSETPPPPPSPAYLWDPGRWSWTGAEFAWEPGKYIEKPAVSATFVPGHWEQNPNGWAWVPSQWDYPGVGSSLPPPR